MISTSETKKVTSNLNRHELNQTYVITTHNVKICYLTCSNDLVVLHKIFTEYRKDPVILHTQPHVFAIPPD